MVFQTVFKPIQFNTKKMLQFIFNKENSLEMDLMYHCLYKTSLEDM